MFEPSIDYYRAHCGHRQTYRLVPTVAPRSGGECRSPGGPVDRPALPAL
jgi:hypothetical protein